MRSPGPLTTQSTRRSPTWFHLSLRFALIALLGQLLLAQATSAATTPITVAAPSFNTSNVQAFQLNGSAVLNTNVIRLTGATTNQSGSAFWKNRVSLANQRSFSSYFVLKFTSPGGTPPGGADGIVFAIQTQSNTAGGSGGGIGYQGITPSVGVEFDTWQNTDVGDPNDNHVGLDVGGSVHSVVTNSTPLPVTLQSGTWHVWVDYNGTTNKLQVRLSSANNRATAPVVLDVTRDLAADIGQDVYVGFTAGTGGAYENHDVQAFYFVNNYAPIDTNPPNTFTQAPSQVAAAASPASIPAKGNTTITATVRDAVGNVMPNQAVTFTTSLGSLVTNSGVTNASGQVQVTLNGGLSGGTATVRATATGGVFGLTTVTVVGPKLYIVYLPVTNRNDVDTTLPW